MLGHRNSYRYRLALRTHRHTYVYDIEHPHDNQLYDSRLDPSAHDDLYRKGEGLGRQFDELRFEHLAPVVPELLEPKEPDALHGIEPEIAERMRALGYIE
jgi:hypothetical protein